MKNYLSLFFLFILCTSTVFAQNKKDVLLSIDGNPVYAREFTRVYKKNLDLVQDESQKDVDGYLQLFIDYKLKIAEAHAQKLDEQVTYKNELSQYRDQLSRNYLFEDKVTEQLAQEAYERGKEDLNVSHILIKVGYDAVPQDTLAAYNKIKMVREKALKGEDFNELAKTYSEEPGAKESEGKLGYFSVFTMVYPFETAAYNTKKGEISDIVRTSYGYHILKVNDRRERAPKISVSHIMISAQGERTFDPEERINEIYTMLQQGESFESLAKQYSDDKNSAVKGGKLNPFSKGDLRSTEFEDAAYKLKNNGDVSKPIKTEFGWHIIRLDEKLAMEAFEQERLMLEKKVMEGDRSKIVTNAINKKIKEKYGFKKGENYLPFFNTYVDDNVLGRKWVRDTITPAQDETIFTIGKKAVHFSDFAKYISQRQRTTRPYKEKEAFLKDLFDEFETNELKEYFKEKLEEENDDYASILSEYRDGLLIFDVMNRNIWYKAKNDTTGIRNYYEKTKENYKWNQRVDADILSANSNMIAQQVKQMLSNGKTAEEIKASLNTNNKVNIILTHGIFEAGERELPKDLEIKQGVSSIYPSNDSFIVVNVKTILPPDIKSLDDVRGKVLSNYQNDIEEKWMDELHSKYKVVVNSKTLKKLKKELK